MADVDDEVGEEAVDDVEEGGEEVAEEGDGEVEGGEVAEDGGDKVEGGEEAVADKKRAPKEKPGNKETLRAIKALTAFVRRVKRRVSVRNNLRYFEPAARDPKAFDEMVGMLDRMREEQASLIAEAKRESQARYTLPIMRRFISEHVLVRSVSGTPPVLPRLSKGKGVANRQMLTAYIYGYLAERCRKISAQTWEVDEDLRGLMYELLGEAREESTVGFSVIPRLVSSGMIAGVEVLERDLDAYRGVLSYYAGCRRSIKEMSKDAVEGEGEAEEGGEVPEDGGEEDE
jgi:hypothetical protein